MALAYLVSNAIDVFPDSARVRALSFKTLTRNQEKTQMVKIKAKLAPAKNLLVSTNIITNLA